MTITSPAFPAGGQIPAKFTCNGQGTSPELRISGTPPGAKSLLLIADDPDAPGGVFTHWLVWNIDPQTTRWAENSVPAGALQGTNDFSKKGYGPPCPPSGTHRYIFKIFALDRPLELKAGARRADVEDAIRGHILAQGELIGRYTHK
ncbi:MAG: YbhB/YbcL family Raf kinase inhibitor-like protein [Verrucomicrobia bacterium]|nr:MAG: YbhB/YbcL family Raf kinase inhibitor-like protein [Verrucomicrobiota bacterium]